VPRTPQQRHNCEPSRRLRHSVGGHSLGGRGPSALLRPEYIQPPRRQLRRYSEIRRAEESSFYADVAIIRCVVCRNLVHPVTRNGCRCTAHHTDGGSESNGEKRQLACPNARGRDVGCDDIRHRRGSSNAGCHRKPNHSAGAKIQKAIEGRGPVSRGGWPGRPHLGTPTRQ
jgi:hypothetical protein